MSHDTCVRAAVCAPEKKPKARHIRKMGLVCTAIFALALTVAIPPLAQAQTFIGLHEFTGGPDGGFPAGALVRDSAGNLFGMTSTDGGGDAGTVYKIDAAGTESTLLTFDLSNGGFPESALILDGAGNLYGTAVEGPGGAGIVFKLSPEGEQTILYAFQGGFGLNPRVPSGGLLMDRFGNLFGATVFGGPGGCQFGCGSVYRLDPAGKLHVLHAFTGGADGAQPEGPLVEDRAGNLYGVAEAGGDFSCPESEAGCGTVFRLARNGQLTVLHAFLGGEQDGATPQPGLLLDRAGNLYGATAAGGETENGIAFKISPDGTYSIVHRFAGNDGIIPNGGLVSDQAGNLFGTTQVGGFFGVGTAFVMTPSGQLTVLHAFAGGFDGANPHAGLIRDAQGNLYGTTFDNFLAQQTTGTAFEITP